MLHQDGASVWRRWRWSGCSSIFHWSMPPRCCSIWECWANRQRKLPGCHAKNPAAYAAGSPGGAENVNGYAPHNPVTLGVVGIVLVATLLAGLAINRLPPRWPARLLAWLVTLGMTAGVERLCRDEPAGVRMLAL